MKPVVINLDEYQKISKGWRIFNIIFGSLTLVLSLIAVVSQIARGHRFSEYFVFVFTFILGLNVLLQTFGIYHRISRRYVIIDNQGVEYKLSYFYPSRYIAWDHIKKVDIRTLRILFTSKKETTYRMKLGEVYYHDIRNLKQTLASACTKKGIEWSDTTVVGEEHLTGGF